jgi:hypothetical protein
MRIVIDMQGAQTEVSGHRALYDVVFPGCREAPRRA